MVNILDRSRRIRQVSGQLMPETTIWYDIAVLKNLAENLMSINIQILSSSKWEHCET